jgi:hypothetical protein
MLIAQEGIHPFAPNLARSFLETRKYFGKDKTLKKCPGFSIYEDGFHS